MSSLTILPGHARLAPNLVARHVVAIILNALIKGSDEPIKISGIASAISIPGLPAIEELAINQRPK